MFNNDQFSPFKHVRHQFGFMALLAVLLNLAFWLGLIYGAFRIAQHFGVL